MGVSTGRQTTIKAKPQPITIDTSQTAVIVVDMQNDFGSKGGMFDRAGPRAMILLRHRFAETLARSDFSGP